MAFRKLLVESRGGLGNQLFSYFYAFSLANSKGLNVEVVTVDSHHKNSNLESVEFIGSQLLVPRVTKMKSKVILIKIYLFLKNSIFINTLLRLFSFLKSDKTLDKNSDPRFPLVVTGYFADFSFYDSLGIEGSNLEVLHPSPEYLTLKSLFEKRKFIAFHIRYGDFLHSAIRDNVLDYEYYMESLKVIDRVLGQDLEIIIFCDQPELLGINFISNNRFSIFDSGDLSAFEVMKIMSSASAMVLCLSTFGFWSAKLSLNNPVVVYPTCNTHGRTFIDGIPARWISQDPPWKV